MNHLSAALFQHLRENGIRYVVLRNYYPLPDDLGGSDLDLWIHSGDAEAFSHVLRELMSEEKAALVSYIPDAHCAKWCLLSERNGIQIDAFVGSVCCRGAVLMPEEVIAENGRDYRNIRVLDDAVADVLAFWKEVLNNGRCSEKYIAVLQHHAYTADSLQRLLPALHKSTLKCFADALQNGDLSRRVGALSRMGQRDLHIRGELLQRLAKLPRLLRRPGYVVAVLGTDGAGKSTVIRALSFWLEEAYHRKVYYQHLRPTLLPDLGVLFGKKQAPAKGEASVIVSDPHGGQTAGAVSSFIRWLYYLADYCLGYRALVWPLVSLRSSVWIFDRYYYDYYIDQKRFGIRLPRWLLRLGAALLVPTPDVILCLGGAPAQIYARKPETSLAEVARQTEELHRFCERNPRAVWIDTTLPQEESVSAARAALLRMMRRRFASLS